MVGLFAFLFLLALVLLPVSVIKPSIINRLVKKDFSRKKLGLIFSGLIITFFVLVGITAPPVTTTPQQSQVQGTKAEKNTQNPQVNELNLTIASPILKPSPTPTPSPTPIPTPTPTKTPTYTIAPQTYTTAPTNCLNGTYVNSVGNTVCRPEQAPSTPAGATAICRDGSYSFSQSRSGTCSHHGGVAQWL